MKNARFSFDEYKDKNPCGGCSSPCCKNLLIVHKVPVTWMDLDYIRYLLNFPKIQVTISKKGEWGILIDMSCNHFDQKSENCKVHGTSEQPRTCVYYNPYQCLYKKKLLDKDLMTIYKLDRERFEHWVQFIKFDDNGSIVDAPSFEKSLEILQKYDCETDDSESNQIPDDTK
jgi:hypothetical protein